MCDLGMLKKNVNIVLLCFAPDSLIDHFFVPKVSNLIVGEARAGRVIQKPREPPVVLFLSPYMAYSITGMLEALCCVDTIHTINLIR